MTEQELQRAVAASEKVKELTGHLEQACNVQQQYGNGGDIEILIRVGGEELVIKSELNPASMYDFLRNYSNSVKVAVQQSEALFKLM